MLVDIARSIADYIHDQFTKFGRDRMRFNEIATQFAKRLPAYKSKCSHCKRLGWTVGALQQIYDGWYKVEKLLINMGLIVIPVTADYFNLFNRREPRDEDERKISLAIYWQAAEGIRLFTPHEAKNDPLAIYWLQHKRKIPTGHRRWDAIRALTEVRSGHIGRGKGQKLLTMILDGVDLPPDMELELKKLFNK